MAEAVVGRRDSFVLCDDGTGRSILRRDEYFLQHRTGRKRVRYQWKEVVDFGGRRSSLQDRHFYGENRPVRAGAQTAIDDSGADGCARSKNRAAATCFWLRPCAARAWRSYLQKCSRTGDEHAARRRPRV